ncbi:ribonucleases P/MRP protein subunit POP1 [Halichoeres trimaculatus]|uniref:ribonucleases P/MRP protein subunit POP1 n=1 Tax=Halichoeres trimaculatus TaxID=147232 RepID=UPI003D9E0E19
MAQGCEKTVTDQNPDRVDSFRASEEKQESRTSRHKMSEAKARMKKKKMRVQPMSVQYSSCSTQNGADTPGPDRPTERSKPPDQWAGWTRGHQRHDGSYAKEMPKFITAGAFARARAAEVSAMSKAAHHIAGTCQVFESLPRHMRRRAMSHNTKRLPRRLRAQFNELRQKNLRAGAKNKEQVKTKSRKARRRHGNLLLEFNRRQRKNVWLETHIWHAKRFFMLKKWGYCLADRPTTKCYRPCYRAMSSHCLLQDLSYYCCIELQGEESNLLASLSQMTSKETGPTFAAPLCVSGQRQGSVVVYKAGHYPLQPVGPVTFVWKPQSQGSTHRQLWIWAHPTLKKDLLSELQAVCQCDEAVVPPEIPNKPEDTPEAKLTPGSKRKQTKKDVTEPPAKKILGDGTRSPTEPSTWKSSVTGITINDLTMEILRFRLIGPQSFTVLAETLKASTDCNEKDKVQHCSLWWSKQCEDEGKMSLHAEQADIYRLLKGVMLDGGVPPGTVLGLTVDDPRLTLPKQKVKALPSVKTAKEEDDEKSRELMLRGVPKHCCQSYLWEHLVRDDVTENKISEKELNHMRSEVLVPGSRLGPAAPQSRVPILLIHQPGQQLGHKMSSWGAGWDLLLPKGWGMAFWIPLVYRGVRIGGLNMSLKHSQNKGVPHFPHDYPDCPSGVRFQDEQEAELLGKFKRRPPAKRTNYVKYGCLAPFRCPWQQLAEEWEFILMKEDGQTSSGTGEVEMKEGGDIPVTKPLSGVSVLRNRKSLKLLSGWCSSSSSKGQRVNRVGSQPPLSRTTVTSFLTDHSMSLVWVRLSMLSKGKPELHAMVCVPTAEDLKLLGKGANSSGPQEPLHKDHFKNRIKLKKKNSKKAAKPSLPSEGETSHLQSSSEPHPTPSEEPKPSSQSSSDLTFGLYPEPLPSVTSHCSRVTLGWVTQADFSLLAGCGEALGFVSVAGLLKTLSDQPVERRGILLLRNPDSLFYRFVKVTIDV